MPMTIPPFTLVGHLLMEQPTLPPIPWPRGYLYASNGVFAWAKREGMEVLLPVSSCSIAGLYPVTPYLRLDYPPVDAFLIDTILHEAREARTPEGSPLEKLWYLLWNQQRGWRLIVPPQIQGGTRVLPIMEEGDPMLSARTLIEIHSHHRMAAYFSPTDTADEKTGFRLYAVVGHLTDDDQRAEIRVRVGLYGHFWEIPAGWVLSLPWGITDCVVRDHMTRPALWRRQTPEEGQ